MSMSDPIADMLTRVRNALGRGQDTVSMPHSKIKEAIANVLKDEGYVKAFEVIPEKPQAVLKIELKYLGDRRTRRSVITGLERVSKPGRRFYVGKKDVPWVLSEYPF
jgi:small subunit ribosomal protein S8